MSSWAVAPPLAMRVAANFRTPCGDSPWSPIRSHCAENHLPKPLALKARPCSLRRYEMVGRRRSVDGLGQLGGHWIGNWNPVLLLDDAQDAIADVATPDLDHVGTA